MPVLSEPLGSSISVYGSAGFAPCRPPQIWVFPQRALTDAALSTDLWWGARFGLASASFQHVILSEICTQLLCMQLLRMQLRSGPAAGAQEINARKVNARKVNARTIKAQKGCATSKRPTQRGCESTS